MEGLGVLLWALQGAAKPSLSVRGQVSVPLHPPCCVTAEPSPDQVPAGKTPLELPTDVFWFGLRSMQMNQCPSCGLGALPSSSSSSLCPGEQPEPPPGASGTQEGPTDTACPFSSPGWVQRGQVWNPRALPGLWLPLSLAKLAGWVTPWEEPLLCVD